MCIMNKFYRFLWLILFLAGWSACSAPPSPTAPTPPEPTLSTPTHTFTPVPSPTSLEDVVSCEILTQPASGLNGVLECTEQSGMMWMTFRVPYREAVGNLYRWSETRGWQIVDGANEGSVFQKDATLLAVYDPEPGIEDPQRKTELPPGTRGRMALGIFHAPSGESVQSLFPGPPDCNDLKASFFQPETILDCRQQARTTFLYTTYEARPILLILYTLLQRANWQVSTWDWALQRTVWKQGETTLFLEALFPNAAALMGDRFPLLARSRLEWRVTSP